MKRFSLSRAAHAQARAATRRRSILASSLAGLTCLSAQAAVDSFSLSPGVPVPDGNASGLVSVINVPSTLGRIVDVDLSITLSGQSFGAWNGDLYVLLAHDGLGSVLINRPGITSSNPFGYGDNGIANITFDDEASAGDFHFYQTLSGASGDSSSPITGTWQPDARGSDPEQVLDTDLRSLFLGLFDGQDAGGEWRLFVADLSRGGTVQLDHWELRLTTDALIPETGTGIMGAGAAVVLFGGLQLWARRRSARNG